MLRFVWAAVPCLFLVACGFSTPGVAIGPDDATRAGDGPIASGDGSVTGDAPMLDAMPDAASCPASFIAITNSGTSSKYLAFPKQSQLDALITCGNFNTHLLRLDNQAEATALELYISSSSGSNSTGLYRVVGARDPILRGLWHDLDLSPLSFLPWGPGEPTDVPFAFEDCIVLKKPQNSAVIGAQECTSKHEFACECD